MIDPITQKVCMTRSEADQCVAILKPLWTGRTSFAPGVSAERIGGDFATDDRGWSVWLRDTNARAGNTHSYEVLSVPATAAEAARVIRMAQGKATKRDMEAFARIAAERQMDRE